MSTASRLSVGSTPSMRESSANASAAPSGRSIQAVTPSRSAIVSRMISAKVLSAAAVIAMASAFPSELSGSAAAFSRTSSRSRSISSAWARSSSTVKRAATFASNGNWCSRRVQNAWMVCTLRPPGVSSAAANRRRACARRPALTWSAPRPRSSTSSAWSSSAIHLASVSNTRFAMLAAAALVNVRHKIRLGLQPSSSSRITRCASTWVLPDPALAATQADVRGSDASICLSRTSRGIGSGAFIREVLRFRRRPTTTP